MDNDKINIQLDEDQFKRLVAVISNSKSLLWWITGFLFTYGYMFRIGLITTWSGAAISFATAFLGWPFLLGMEAAQLLRGL